MKSKKPSFNTKNNSTMILVIIAALALSIGVVWSKKAIDDIGDYRQLLSHEQNVLSILEENRQNIEELGREAQVLEQEGLSQERVLGALPLSYQPAADLANLELMADSSGVQLQDVSVTLADQSFGTVLNSGAEISGLSPHQVQVTALGSYNGLKAWFDNIEASKQPMIVNSLQIAAADRLVSVQLVMVLYTQDSSLSPQVVEEGLVE